MAGWDYGGQPFFAQVASSATRYWGVDSVTHADTPISGTTFFNLVKAQTGKPPAFWGRYIGSPTRDYNLTREETGYLASQNCRILLIYSGHAYSRSIPGGLSGTAATRYATLTPAAALLVSEIEPSGCPQTCRSCALFATSCRSVCSGCATSAGTLLAKRRPAGSGRPNICSAGCLCAGVVAHHTS